MAFLLFFLSLFFEPHPTPQCFLLSVIGLLSLPSWLVICLAFVFQVFVLLLSSVFLFSAGGQTVGRCRSSRRQAAERLRSPACRRWLTPGPHPGWRSRWWSWSSSAGRQQRHTGWYIKNKEASGPLRIVTSPRMKCFMFLAGFLLVSGVQFSTQTVQSPQTECFLQQCFQGAVFLKITVPCGPGSGIWRPSWCRTRLAPRSRRSVPHCTQFCQSSLPKNTHTRHS